MICCCRRNRSSSKSRELARGQGHQHPSSPWLQSLFHLPASSTEPVGSNVKIPRRRRKNSFWANRALHLHQILYIFWLRKREDKQRQMASRNAGGGSQGLGRQSSVATPSGSVMKSRQLVSFVFETSVFFFFFFFLSFFPLLFYRVFALSGAWVVAIQLINVYRHIYILSWLCCQKTYQILRIY